MIFIESADILKTPKIDAIMHQCNCQHVMGGGIAKAIKDIWPQVHIADKKYSYKGDHKKMGTVLPVYVDGTTEKKSPVKVVFNAYAQFYFGKNDRCTDYEAFYLCCEDVCKQIARFNENKIENQKIKTLGVPYGIGAGLGGGNWNIIYAIMKETIGQNKEFNTLVCRLDSVFDENIGGIS